MPRLRLYDIRFSRLARVSGICQGDTVGNAAIANAVEERLVKCPEAGEEGWFGGWAHMAFTIARSDPFITAPRQVARIEKLTVCSHPINIRNQFYEYLAFGAGDQKFRRRLDPMQPMQMFDRGRVPTFHKLVNGPKIIRVYCNSGDDGGQRILIQGTDSTGARIYNQDGYNQVAGFFLPLAVPFVETPMPMFVDGIQKDITTGSVQIFQVDPNTGEELPLSTMDPGESVADYRQYQIGGLPPNCCGWRGEEKLIEVQAIVKLEPVPVVSDTDYLLIQCLEAFIAEAQAMRYGEMDATDADTKEAVKHRAAVRYLNGELTHYMGKNNPALQFKPFGSASLDRVNISMR